MRVRAVRAAVVAGLIGGLFLVAAIAVRGLPDRVVALFGGPSTIERHGGLVLRYRPPAGADLSRFEGATQRGGGTVRLDGEVLHVEVPGLDEVTALETADHWLEGGLEFREVVESDALKALVTDPQAKQWVVAPGVRVELDVWRPESGGEHVDFYLDADNPDDLRRGFDEVRARGWEQPADTTIGFERIEEADGVRWRSYLLGPTLLDGGAIAQAQRVADPATTQPLVLVEFSPAGATRFAEITEELDGHKLAWVKGGRVLFAPYINGAIRNGQVQIRPPGDDLAQQEVGADNMLAAVSVVPLPPGGKVEERRWVAPASIGARVALWLAALGALGGALVGVIVGVAIRVARPSWRPRPARGQGGRAMRRLVVTLFAPAAVIALHQIPWPGINDVELDHVLHVAGRGGAVLFTIGDLGVGPVISAFLVVEVFTLLTRRWRRARMLPAWRIGLGRWVAIIGIVLAVLQAYFAVRYASALLPHDVSIFEPGLASYAAAMASLVGSTMLLVFIAGVIRQHGLGNGYGALLVSAGALAAARAVLAEPSAGHLLGLVGLAAIGCATVALLRMRVGDDTEAPLRALSSGVVPLGTTVNVVTFLLVIRRGAPAMLGAGPLVLLTDHAWFAVGALILFVPLWSFAFSRPAVVAPLAAHTPLAAPSWSTWRRATLLSWVWLSLITGAWLIAAAVHPAAPALCEATSAMMFAAVVLDIVDDLRARRADFALAWPAHQPQHAELIQRVLADAGIDCHLRAGHLRTLLAFFGPHVPIDVLVPAAQVDAARSKIATLYGETPLGEVFG